MLTVSLIEVRVWGDFSPPAVEVVGGWREDQRWTVGRHRDRGATATVGGWTAVGGAGGGGAEASEEEANEDVPQQKSLERKTGSHQQRRSPETSHVKQSRRGRKGIP
jgi:hypothetical protein